MQIKTLYILLISIFILPSAHAQDTLYKRDGSIVIGHIREISPKLITYSHYDSPDGPEYVVNKKDVSEIKYQNGTVDMFNASNKDNADMPAGSYTKGTNHKYGKSILFITPMAFVGQLDIESGVALGGGYEISLDRKKMLSFCLPFLFELNSRYSNDNYGYYNNIVPDKNYYSFFVMPGLKFYPTGNNGIVRYSVGPSFYINTGEEQFEEQTYNNQTGTTTNTYYNKNYTAFGIMLVNSLNIFPTPHLYLGLDYSMGIPYVDNRPNYQGLGNSFLDPLVQFSFKVGFRF